MNILKKEKNKIIIIFFIFLILVMTINNSIKKINNNKKNMSSLSTKIIDKKKKIIEELYIEKRTQIDINKIPKNVINAFIITEDSNFYKHNGINYLRLLNALINEMKHKIYKGNRIGGSTITQQLVRTKFLQKEQTYFRKIKEIIIAKKIEKEMKKKEILTEYLNKIYFGNGVYGIEEASNKYFNKKTTKITLNQAAILASIPKNPNKINPINNIDRLKNRKNYILKKMLENNMITDYEFNKAIKEKIKINKKKKKNNYYKYYTELIRQILVEKFGSKKIYNNGLKIYIPINIELQKIANKTLKKGLRKIDKKHGWRGPIYRIKDKENKKKVKKNLEKIKNKYFKLNENQNKTWDLKNIELDKKIKTRELDKKIKIKKMKKNQLTTGVIRKIDDKKKIILIDLGSSLQTLEFKKINWTRKFNPTKNTEAPKKPSEVLNKYDIVYIRIKKVNPIIIKLEQLPKIEGSIIVINSKTNEIIALSGGYSFKRSKFNRSIQAKRQPGSTIKPFIYSMAIEKKNIMPNIIINDIPKAFINIKENNENWWKPKNHTEKYLGDITIRTCLINSINICSISLLELIGIKDILLLAKKINLITKYTPFSQDLTLALGSSEIIPINLINAYSIFPNLGKFSEPILINKIKTNNNNIIYIHKKKNKQVIRPQTAFIITNLLKEITKKIKNKHFNKIKVSIAGKTGTSNQMKSLWFVGYTQNLIIGVYSGYDNNISLGNQEYAIKITTPIWCNFLEEAQFYIKKNKFKEPVNIKWKRINKKNGNLITNIIKKKIKQKYKNNKIDDNDEYFLNNTILEAFIEGFEPKKNQDKKYNKFFKYGGLIP